jgi:hypothetical protein
VARLHTPPLRIWHTLTPEQLELIREVLRNHPQATARDVVDELKAHGGI